MRRRRIASRVNPPDSIRKPKSDPNLSKCPACNSAILCNNRRNYCKDTTLRVVDSVSQANTAGISSEKTTISTERMAFSIELIAFQLKK